MTLLNALRAALLPFLMRYSLRRSARCKPGRTAHLLRGIAAPRATLMPFALMLLTFALPRAAAQSAAAMTPAATPAPPPMTQPAGTASSRHSTAGEGSPAAMLENTLRLYLDQQTAGLPGRVEVSVGALTASARLPACATMEPFIPPGTRLWGRTALGVRCSEGARWSVLIPVQVRIYAPVLQSTRPLQAGQPLAPGDFALFETELTREPPGLLGSPEDIVEQVLARPVPAGMALRREHFRPRTVAAAGDAVTLVYPGAGFTVSGPGKLLQSATEGQTVRVQVDSGRILSGIARAGRSVVVQH